MKPTGCVYLAINLITGSCYIGKSLKGMQARKTDHERSITRRVPKTYFGRALAKYHPQFFSWLEIFYSDDPDLLAKAEIQLISDYQEAGRNLYNLTAGGEGTAGYIMSEESRAKMRLAWESRKRKPISEETRAKISAAAKKNGISPETRAKMLASRAGYRHSPETIEKIREKKKRENLSPETRAKLSYSSKGRVCREETKEKIRASMKKTLAEKKKV